MRNDKIVGEWYWGRRSPSPEAPPYNANTMTPLMSITKGLTATALALLIQDGTMWLDEKVSEYIPEFKEGDLAKITVRLLATHSSGLPGSDVDWQLLARPASGRNLAGNLLPPCHVPDGARGGV